ncbi:hypothetical protein AVEN_202758-1, partial [Araneus ventricosus]
LFESKVLRLNKTPGWLRYPRIVEWTIPRRDYSLGMLRCIVVSSVLGDARVGAEDDTECGAGGVNFLHRLSAWDQAEWDPAGESEKKG